MSLQREKFAPAYNRAREKLCIYRARNDHEPAPFEYEYDDHDNCSYCNPSMEDIRKGYLLRILSKLNFRSVVKILNEYL